MSTVVTLTAFMALTALGLTDASAAPVDGAFTTPGVVAQAAAQASHRYSVPEPLLLGLCQLEGRLSNHGGSPSRDNGFGCMHLVQNDKGDTLDAAARDLNVPVQHLKSDLATNIAGGAAVLADDARALSPIHQLPASLPAWYGAVAAYSHASTRSTALMYADALFRLLNTGFTGQTETGEVVSLPSQGVQPDVSTAASVQPAAVPSGCQVDTNVDYPGAVDCILPPQTYDCNTVPSGSPCNYASLNRPTDFPIRYVTIHDVEGTAQDALNVFQNASSGASAHYVVDSDGTIYQVVREKDEAFHAGNSFYNHEAVGIEHAGFDATGYQWYNATEYLASAKLVAYLLKKYNMPLDHTTIMSHGTTPCPFLSCQPNHVDPGPYWLWDYYFGLIQAQGVALPQNPTSAQIVSLHPQSDQAPVPSGSNPEDAQKNFSFFYLYNGPSTASGRIASLGSDITDVTNNVEPALSYYWYAKAADPAGSGDTMYEVWYGESDSGTQGAAHGKLVWLAVPPGAAQNGDGTIMGLNDGQTSAASVYGRPTTDSQYVIGSIPANAIVASQLSVIEDGTTNLWYEINFNHRQAWLPASEVTVNPPPPPPNCTTYTSLATGSHQVCGAIRDKYQSLGGPSSFLGYPITNELATPDGIGRFNHFSSTGNLNNVDGSIYWTPNTGAWSIHAGIRAKWASLGWERSFLGYPVTDETGTPDGIGRFNHFSNAGSIYWTPGTGAWSVHGAIRDKWASLGWERSCLGYPVTDEFAISGGRQSNFQHGFITWNARKGTTKSSC
jgi:N-acetyl-anhydromuramyl-L-alanine amidase AmpD